MALNITKSDEAILVTTINLVIYSQPGIGKTSLAYTASKPVLFDFDKGAHRAIDRKDTVLVTKWADVASVTAADLYGYDTIVIDTVGKALDFLTQSIIERTPKLATGGALNQRGWGQLGVQFSAFLKRLNSFGKDVVLIAHMDERRDGDEVKERLKIAGGTKDSISTDADVMARLSIIDKQRKMVFSPTETSFGKDPTNIGELAIPLAQAPEYKTFLSDVIANVKAGLNKLSEEQVARKSEREWFVATLPDITDAPGINDLLGRAKKAGKDIALLLVNRARELGLEYDEAHRKYVDRDAPVESTHEEIDAEIEASEDADVMGVTFEGAAE